MISVSAIKVY